MKDEKKEDSEGKITQAPKAESPKAAEEQKNVATPAPQASAETPAAAAKEEKKAAAPAKKERPANCEGCKKSIKKKRWYYRDGKYYCTKRCWRSTANKDKKKESTTATPAS
ncbi:MAG: hypothetical protein NC938_01055 [Candidatus Omnitrophica bacterium]|nr:hypothetical protein [Candidatus Omnitrophota bacterium]